MPDSKPTSKAAVATPHAEAAAAAAAALRGSGNAVDAAVAATLALCVVTPGSVGIGGYGGSMVAYLADRGRCVALDFDSRAPLDYRDDLFMTNPTAGNFGYLAVTVPAVVAGLDLALREFGTFTFRDAAAHALALAEGGFTIDVKLRKQLQDWTGRTDPLSVTAMFASGTIPEEGAAWVQADLAKLIRRLCDEGPGALYLGEVPRAIVRQVRAHGGILTEADFESYQPQIVDPIRTRYRGFDLFTPPPPSGGITSFQILAALERFDVAAMGPWNAPYVHTLAEVSKACWQDRDRYLGDPDVVTVPVDEMLSSDRAAAIAAAVGPRASAGVAAAPMGGGLAHTVNVLTADARGNLVSLTATQGYLYGSQVAIAGLGLFLGHGMSRFTYVPGNPNAPAPLKRMLHNMAPTVALEDGRPRLAFGMPGGTKIPNVTAQLVCDVVDFRMRPDQAVVAPRLHTEGGEPLVLSPSIPEPVVAELERMGHQVKREPSLGGPVNALAIDGHTGQLAAASEAGAACARVL